MHAGSPSGPSCWTLPTQPTCWRLIRQLTLLQIDPTAAVAPNVDLVAWSRLGSAYQPAQLRQALEVDRTLFEFDAMIRPDRATCRCTTGQPSSAWFRSEQAAELDGRQ